MRLFAGQVIRIPDPNVRPRNKPKWHICVCPARRFFLRINSSPQWQPWHPIESANNDFLDHDSYVELLELHHFTEAALGVAIEIGRMSASEMDALAAAAVRCATLSGEHKEIIDENLASPF